MSYTCLFENRLYQLWRNVHGTLDPGGDGEPQLDDGGGPGQPPVAGGQTAGVAGGLAAVLGVLTPTLTLTLAAALLFERFRGSRRLNGVLRVIKPMCIAMIAAVILTLSGENYLTAQGLDWAAVGIAALSFVLLRRFHWQVPWVIAQAAGWGILLYGILPGLFDNHLMWLSL